ncbi:MAG: hypothetical protein Q9197_007002, partial [Variospora fuerteventurae]
VGEHKEAAEREYRRYKDDLNRITALKHQIGLRVKNRVENDDPVAVDRGVWGDWEQEMTGLLRKVVGWEEELLGMEMEVRNAWVAANSGIFLRVEWGSSGVACLGRVPRGRFYVDEGD